MSQLEALKNGIRHLEPVDLSASHGPSEIWVRPLSSREAGLVERMKIQGFRTDVKVDGASVNAAPVVDDVSLLMEKQHQARITTVQFGLSHSGETCSYEQAAELPAPWVEALAQGMEMSALSQVGIPPAATQAELTPLQRRALLEALVLQQEQIERQHQETARRYR